MRLSSPSPRQNLVRGTLAGLVTLTVATALSASPSPDADSGSARVHPPARPVTGGGQRASPSASTAGQAARSLARKGIPVSPSGKFQPNQAVTRGELAIILVRMIDYLENRGPQKVSQSKSPPLVSPRVRAGLAALPHRHRAYPALARLAKGGYLLPSDRGELFLPTPQNLDRPVTARELSAALAGIASRIAEKRAVLEHPQVLEEQRDTVTAPGQHRGMSTPPQ